MNLNSVVQRVQNYLSFKLGQEMMKSAGGGGFSLYFIKVIQKYKKEIETYQQVEDFYFLLRILSIKTEVSEQSKNQWNQFETNLKDLFVFSGIIKTNAYCYSKKVIESYFKLGVLGFEKKYIINMQRISN